MGSVRRRLSFWKNDTVRSDMSPIVGLASGTIRTTTSSSTVTTPISPLTASFYEPPGQQESRHHAGLDYKEKLNGTLKPSKLKAFRTSSNAASITKHLRIHKLPQPQRCEIVFKTLDDALKECILVTQRDIQSLQGQLDSSLSLYDGQQIDQDSIAEIQKQLKAAERYLKRLAFHGSRIEELRDLYQSQLAIVPDGETQPLSSVVRQRQHTQKSYSATNSFKGAFKDLVNIICKLEAELEMLSGTLNIQVKGVAGFARLAPGDVFEVQLKCGAQKWKSKVKIGTDKIQTWEADAVNFKCMVEDYLEIKVLEHKGFGKSVLLIEKTLDPIQLFRAHPQLITVELNRTGSIKLNLQSTWNPLEGLLTPLTTASGLMHSTATLNGASRSNSNSSSMRSTAKISKSSDLKMISIPSTSITDLSILDNQASIKSPLLPNGHSIKNGSTVVQAPAPAPAQRSQNGHSQSPFIRYPTNGDQEMVTSIKSDFNISSHSKFESDRLGAINLAQVLRRLKPIVHSSATRFQELSAMENIIFKLDLLLTNTSQNGGIQRLNRTTMADYFGNVDRLNYLDDLDDNVLNRPSSNGNRSQFNPDHGSNGHAGVFSDQIDPRHFGTRDLQLTPSSPSSSASSASPFNHDTAGRRRRYLKKGEASPVQSKADLFHNSPLLRANSATLERPRSTVFGSRPMVGMENEPIPRSRKSKFGVHDLDVCLYHHLVHCEMLLQKLVGFGPLHHSEQEALYKLTVETSILAYLASMANSVGSAGLSMPKLTQVLTDLDASTELQDVWLSAAGAGMDGYFLPVSILRKELRRSYGPVVQAKYQDLAEKVIDKVINLLTDRSIWDPEIVTVFQFIYCFHEKELTIFIESMAHETWIVETINCRVRAKIQRVIDRLKHVPVPPPPDVLRHIGLLLVDDGPDLRILAESYLGHAQGSLRADLVGTYMAFLEHEDAETRRGACRALAVLNARRSMSALAFVSHNDRKGAVREEARRAVTAFGLQQGTLKKDRNGRENGNGMDRHRIEENGVRF